MKEYTLENVFTEEHLYKSYLLCLKGVKWKGTVQKYDSHALSNLYITRQKVLNEKFETGKFYNFTRIERGKLREIKSVKINERVVQRCLCDYCLVPTLTKKFIYDNSACVKGKGIHFAQNRFKYHLQKYFKKYKTNIGYILQFDMHHYFETIPHDNMKRKVNELIQDKKLNNLYNKLIDDFGGQNGLGLGSQISQISALYYMSDIDHTLIKEQGVFAYARYMDDGYIISHNYNALLRIKELLKELVKNEQLVLNDSKTIIRRLDKTITFLKIRFNLINTGKVFMRIARATIVRNRRKLKKLFKLNKDIKLIDNYVKCVIGNRKKYNSFYTTKNFLLLYNKLKENYL